MSTATLQAGLTDLQRRFVRAGVIKALAWSALLGLVVLLAAMWLDLVVDLPPSLRITCASASFIGAVILLARISRSAVIGNRPRAIAHKLDEAAAARGEIVSGVDLAMYPSAGAGAMTMGLSMLAVQRAAELAGRVPSSALAPLKGLSKPVMLLIAFGVFVLMVVSVAPRLVATQWARFIDPFGDHPPYSPLVFSVQPGNARVVYGGAVDVDVKVAGGAPDRVDLVLLDSKGQKEPLPMFPESDGSWRVSVANVTQGGRYFATAGRARSEQYKLDLITVPRIESVHFHIIWPAYTHRPPYDGPLPQGGLVGLPGTNVTVTARSNRQLSGGAMSFIGAPTTLPTSPATPIVHSLVPSGANEVDGSFEIRTPGKLSLQVTDVEKQQSTDIFTAAVGVLKDERPFVRLTDPKANSFATPDASIHVVAMAEDDFGVARVSVYRGLNDTRPRPMEIPVPPSNPSQYPAAMTLPLSDYGLKPGDVVKLYARVEDNDPAGAKGAESTIVVIHVVSQQDMDKMVLEREGLETLESKYAQAARRMEQMADRAKKLQDELFKLDPNSALADEDRKALEKLAREMEAAATEIEKQADHQLPIDLDKALTEELSKSANALREAARQTRAAGQPGQNAAGAGEQLAAARKSLGQEQQDFKENAQDPLDHMAAVYPLVEDEARFIDLAQQQKDLADRMSELESVEGKDDPQAKARMRDLQEEQEKARQDLRELLDDIQAHADKLPADARLDDLRKTAKDFAAAVEKSDAQPNMQASEDALNDFAGLRASVAAHQAAKTLEDFIARCNNMGDKACKGLKFQPKLASSLGNTVAQLLAASGLPSQGKMGQGMGGYSAMRSSLKNVGLYGNLPIAGKDSAKSGGGKGDRGGSAGGNGQPNPNATDGSNPIGAADATGDADPAVPPEYRKRVGDYFRRVADELEP